MAALTLNTGLPNRRSGSTGSAAYRADSHQRRARITAPANNAMITAEPHG
jgi:hypothetical protein